jgi:hypothetical protein
MRRSGGPSREARDEGAGGRDADVDSATDESNNSYEEAEDAHFAAEEVT